ncbi:hypothetical protein BDB01DRAFT_43897 [Pilobolus umbonatus]|nr:hypothetical protein BDB01DRAFT_43897 [Pilobolus umbonatus]
MAKGISLLAGAILATALTYQSRISLISHTAQVQQHVDDIKVKADLMSPDDDKTLIGLSLNRPLTTVEKCIDNSKVYYHGRFMPSLKESWNSQISCVASTLIQSNLPSKISHFVSKNVFGSSV